MDDDEEWHVLPNGLSVKGKHHPRIVDGIDTYTGERADAPGNVERPYWDDPALRVHSEQLRTARREAAREPDVFTRRRQIINSVINDTQKPAYKPFDAEMKITAELGPTLGNFAQFVTEADRTALQNEGWPWHVACCWIMTQDPKQALLAVASFGVWQGCTIRDNCRPGHIMSFAQASGVLRRALIRGEVRAKRDDGALAQEIAQEEWSLLSWPVVDGETRCFDKLSRDGVPAYEKPVIVAADVLRWKWTLNGPEPLPGLDIEQERLTTLSPEQDPKSQTESDKEAVEPEIYGPWPLSSLTPKQRLDQIKIITATITNDEALRWDATPVNKQPGAPKVHPFKDEIERLFGGSISRDKEARPVWDSRPIPRRKGRPPKHRG